MSSVKKIKSDPKTTILVITLGMTIVYLITQAKWTLQVGLIVGILGLMSGWMAEKIDWAWMKLTQLLSMIVPNILLSVVFYIFLTPVAFLSRIFGNQNPLDIRNTRTSLFKDHGRVADKATFEKPW